MNHVLHWVFKCQEQTRSRSYTILDHKQALRIYHSPEEGSEQETQFRNPLERNWGQKDHVPHNQEVQFEMCSLLSGDEGITVWERAGI